MRTSVISNRAVKTIYFKQAVCVQQLNLVVLTACMSLLRGIPMIWQRGGGKKYFFPIWKFAHVEVMRFARGVRGLAPPRTFFKWCNLVRFGVYLDQVLS